VQDATTATPVCTASLTTMGRTAEGATVIVSTQWMPYGWPGTPIAEARRIWSA
jgi:hypothetical protein